jgi:hypothetical protein
LYARLTSRRLPLLWLAVPLLAFLAYGTVFRIGFLSDDFLLLYTARAQGIDPQAWLPDPTWFFYRPVGTFLTWQAGWQLWGFNPFPYHLLGLLIHAASSLLLGLWLARVASNRAIGWLAGALFAVFPLHSEAVGWLAAQWDALATLFALLSLWLFLVWYRNGGGRWHLYALSLLSFTLGVFTKESLLTFLPLFALSAWLAVEQLEKGNWRRLAIALLPFCAPIGLNLALRLATWSTLTGYRTFGADYAAQFWDGLIARAHMLLSPINSALVGSVVAQALGMISSVGLLVGLVLYGRRNIRLLTVVAAWIVLALLPALDFPVKTTDLQNNGYLYLAAAGYCVGVAALLYTAISDMKRRALSYIVVGAILSVGVAACWVNLYPWHIATVQATELERELLSLIPAPSQARPQPMVWYAEGTPDNYKGAYIFRLGLGGVRDFTAGDGPNAENVGDASQVDVASEDRDAFALRFAYDEGESRFHVSYGIGKTGDSEPPGLEQAVASNSHTWDFRACSPQVIAGWQALNADTGCVPGRGLTISPRNLDPQLILPALDSLIKSDGASYVRILASVSYPIPGEEQPVTAQWFWHGPTNDWGGDRTRTLPIRRDGLPHTYWTLLSAGEAGDISALRFDPVNGDSEATVRWIALDAFRK